MRASSAVQSILVTAGLAWCSAVAAGALCSSSEETLFSCRFKAKVASVCALTGKDGRIVYVQYRFGGSGVEIAIPAKEPFDMTQITGQVFSGAHGGAEEVVFANGEYSYRVQTSWDMRNRNYDAAEVRVTKGQAPVSRFECKPTTPLGRDDQGLRRLILTSGMKPLQ